MIKECVIFNPQGGTEGHSQTYATNLCTGLSEIGVKAHLVTSRDFDETDVVSKGVDVTYTTIGDSRKRTVRYNSLISKLRYGAFIVGNNLRSLSVLKKVLTARRRSACVLAGGDTLTNILYVLLAPQKRRSTLSLTIHNADYDLSLYRHDPVKFAYKAISKSLLRTLLRTEAVVFVHGEAMQQALARQLRVESGRISIYKVPTKEVLHLERDAEDRRPGCVRLLFCGVVRHDKGFDLLCEALSKCAHRNSWHLRIAGSTRQVGEDYVYGLTKKFGIDANCSYNLKYLTSEELGIEFQNADIVVLPYRRGFIAQSVVMTDAIRWGKPVIASRHSQNGYDALRFHLGWVFESENVESLTDALNTAIGECLGQTPKWGFAEFMEAHSPSNVAKNIMLAVSSHAENRVVMS